MAEKLVNTAVFTAQPEATPVPHFMVQAFAIMPRGAWPGSCWPLNEIDYPAAAGSNLSRIHQPTETYLTDPGNPEER